MMAWQFSIKIDHIIGCIDIHQETVILALKTTTFSPLVRNSQPSSTSCSWDIVVYVDLLSCIFCSDLPRIGCPYNSHKNQIDAIIFYCDTIVIVHDFMNSWFRSKYKSCYRTGIYSENSEINIHYRDRVYPVWNLYFWQFSLFSQCKALQMDALHKVNW